MRNLRHAFLATGLSQGPAGPMTQNRELFDCSTYATLLNRHPHVSPGHR
jgi:hypothetical protein